ncbi:MAG: nucleotidyltransferase family protein [Burkholderiaceae bacterium]
MDRSTALDLLTRHKPEIAAQFAVRELSLFGSTARGKARQDSDVDILVAFEGPATSARFFGLQFYLEDLLGCKVDLVTDKALRAELKPYVEKDLIHV